MCVQGAIEIIIPDQALFDLCCKNTVHTNKQNIEPDNIKTIKEIIENPLPSDLCVFFYYYLVKATLLYFILLQLFVKSDI